MDQYNTEKAEMKVKKPDMFDNITNYEVDFSEYDKSDHSFDQKLAKSNKRSIILTCFNTFRSFVAIGILSLPYAVMLVGPLIGFFGLLFIAVIIYISFVLLLEIADDSKFKGSNFETLGKLIWGKPGQQLILIMLYICCIATFMGGTLFSIDFLDFAFCSHNVESLCHSRNVFLFVALIVSFVISLIESLKFFGYISIASTFIIILALFSITGYNLHFLVTSTKDLSLRIEKTSITNFLDFLGIAFYTTEGIGLVLPIRASFKDNKKFPKVFYSTYVFIIWCYVIVSVLSYLVIQKEIF